jgi:RsmE family RNA methyltransferase
VNLLLFEPGEVVDGRAALGDRRGRHLARVLKVAPGQRVRAGVIGGGVGDAEVIAIDGEVVTLAFAAREAAPAPAPVDLVVAVPRPKVLSRLLAHAASYAVRRIDLVNAWRVDKSYLGSSRLDDDAIGQALRLGAEQGMTTHLPEVEVHPLLMGFLDDALPRRAPARRLLADARAGVDLERAQPPGDRGAVMIAIGPEGGWIARELVTFESRGFTLVKLGTAVLRVETAVTAALAQLELLRRLPAPAC